MRRMTVILSLILALAAACNPATPTPLPPPPQPPRPQATVIITLTPHAEPTGTATPDLQIEAFVGRWQLYFRYQFDGGAIIRQTRFLGGVTVQIGGDGSVFGQGSLTTAVQHEGCDAVVTDDGEIRVSVEGQVRRVEGGLELVFRLIPEDPERVEHYRLRCPDFTEPVEIEQQTLWPSLEALGVQPYVMPLQIGAAIQRTDDVSGPTRQRIQGTLTTEIRLSQ
jgi:hypothetical protein